MERTIILLLLFFALFGCRDLKEYQLKLTFCDGEPPLLVSVQSYIIPTNNDIKKLADGSTSSLKVWSSNDDVTSPFTYINVCSITILQEKLKK